MEERMWRTNYPLIWQHKPNETVEGKDSCKDRQSFRHLNDRNVGKYEHRNGDTKTNK